jgi:hypothetical protein
MMRLTVHVENAPFNEIERKVIGKDLQGNDMFKPKRSKCIQNTLSFRGLESKKDVLIKLEKVRSKYKIAKFPEKRHTTYNKDREMVYVSNY